MLKSIAARRGAGMFSEHVEYTGIGWDWTKIRSLNSYIDEFAGAGGGVIPFLKITNDVAIAVDQTGRLCPHI